MINYYYYYRQYTLSIVSGTQYTHWGLRCFVVNSFHFVKHKNFKFDTIFVVLRNEVQMYRWRGAVTVYMSSLFLFTVDNFYAPDFLKVLGCLTTDVEYIQVNKIMNCNNYN